MLAKPANRMSQRSLWLSLVSEIAKEIDRGKQFTLVSDYEWRKSRRKKKSDIPAVKDIRWADRLVVNREIRSQPFLCLEDKKTNILWLTTLLKWRNDEIKWCFKRSYQSLSTLLKRWRSLLTIQI